MEIILNHDEFLVLQNVRRDPNHYNPKYHDSVPSFKTLLQAGLIETGCAFCPIFITPLGAEVLSRHEPWCENIYMAGNLIRSKDRLRPPTGYEIGLKL